MRNAAATLVLALCGLATPALAQSLQTGQCLPATTVRTTLTAEGQNPIILGSRTGYGYATALIFTSNATGSRGYLLRGDKPLGEQAETICVDSVYRDIRLNDIARSGIPSWAELPVDRARAEADCRENRLGYQEMCQPYDQSVANLRSNGVNVMLMATGTVINPRDRTSRPNQTIVLFVDPSDQAGMLEAVTGSGASYTLSAYTKASFTQHGTALLGGS